MGISEGTFDGAEVSVGKLLGLSEGFEVSVG